MNNLDEVIEFLSVSSSKADIAKLLEELLTPSELEDIAKRWHLMKDIYLGKPQREIASEMEISLCKITRGSRILKQDNSIVRRIFNEKLDDHTHI
ncbi:MAG: Trp family transcriptional regulator [Sphaerochaetaceae bacterium]|jgi:TrpR family trp operon transcriptional repressor|nr:Trp family transcriptional regulator [Sphaerochaetaceae bacterium]